MAKARDDAPNDIETLLAMFEHEVRTPLSVIVGLADLLHPDMDARELADVVPRIRANARLLSDVVDGLRGIGESEPGWSVGEEAPMSLEALVASVAESLRAQADAKGLRLAFHLDSQIPPSVVGARGKLCVVLRNLVANALKFTDAGEVVVRVECVGQTVSGLQLRYSVADTGRGIRVEHHEAILKPFVRSQEESNTDGRGLGLSICSKLLQTLGSKMEIDSRPTKGATFSFVLSHPRPDGTRVPNIVRRPGIAEMGRKAARVLIVDDNDDSLHLLRRLVRREGFVTDVARDGSTSLSMFERHGHRVVLTDLHMAGMGGLELSRRLREHASRSNSAPPLLVAVTASSLLGGRGGQTLQDAFDDILLKPVRPRVLSRLLAPFQTDGAQRSCDHGAASGGPVDTSVHQVAAGYLTRRARDIRVLRAFLAGRASFAEVEAIGHNLKGSAASYGAPQLGELGAALEHAARRLDVEGIASLTEAIECLVHREAPTSGMERLASKPGEAVSIRHR